MAKSVFKNTIFLNIKTVVTTLVSLFSTRIVLNALGAEDFGLYGVVAGSVAMMVMFNSALSISTQRFMNLAIGKEIEKEKKQVFNNAILLHMGLGLLIVIALESLYYPMFNGILNIQEDRIDVAKLIYHLMCVSTFFTIITVPYDALINAHEDFLYYSVVGIIESLLKLGTALLILWISIDKLFVYGLLLAFISIFMMIIMRIYCKRKYVECVFAPKTYFNRSTLKSLSSFAGWRFIGVFSNFFGNHGSNLLMNHYFGTIVIAAKNIGDQIGGQLQLVSSNMMRAFNPVIIKAESRGDSQQMLGLSMQACKFGYLLYLIFAIPFILSMPMVLNFWLKNVPEWTVLFCQLQIIRMMLEQLSNPLYTTLTAKGDIRAVSIFDLVLGVITFSILYSCYSLGTSPETHYIVSIIFLVVASSIIKIILCKKKCDLVIMEYTSIVILPCIITTILSLVFGFGAIMVAPSFIAFCLNIIFSMIIVFALGLSQSEQDVLISFIKYKVLKR